MEQRRFLVFFTVSMLIWVGWIHFLVPMLFPQPPKQKAAAVSPSDEPADALWPENQSADAHVQAAAANIPQHPVRSLWIGPEKDDKDPAKFEKFLLAAKFRSEGASIETVELTDIQHYPRFGRRDRRVRLVGDDNLTDRRTFGMQIPQFEKQFKGLPFDHVSWDVIEETADSVTFSLRSPDGVWEIAKKFQLRQLTDAEQKQPGVRDNLADAYKLKLTITLKNISARAQAINYTLLGPTGVPLEDADNAYKHRDIRMGFLRDDGSAVDDSKMAATDVVKKAKADAPILWKRPLKYLGIDVAYFAALVLPGDDQIKQRTLDGSNAVMVTENKDYPQYSDISVDLTSKEISVPANGEVEHHYTLFAGPKRQQLLTQVYAAAVLDYGWFDSICRGMLWILNLFHSMGISYGLAIICLTVVVRTCLIPLSKHQAAHAAKMKELQPKIQAKQKELEARHGKNTEEYIKASQELVAEQSKMMLGGCLPMFLQLPIFIALYRALSSSIELRMEPFLWFENLATPDALFALPFKIPFLGWTEFNLLPCISIGLMMVHQKLTMPPPQNEEQAAQYKMMNIMMFVMGATFYRVPAGLCLYFISTNIWSMTERTYFERKAKALALNPPPASIPLAPGAKVEPKKPSAWMGLWKQLQDAADKDVSIRRDDKNDKKGPDSRNGDGQGPDGKNGKKKGKR